MGQKRGENSQNGGQNGQDGGDQRPKILRDPPITSNYLH